MAPKLAIVAQNTLIRFAMGVLAQLLEEYSKIGSFIGQIYVVHGFKTQRKVYVQIKKENLWTAPYRDQKNSVVLCVVRSRCFCFVPVVTMGLERMKQRTENSKNSLVALQSIWVLCGFPTAVFVSSCCWWSRHRRTNFKTTTAANAHQQFWWWWRCLFLYNTAARSSAYVFLWWQNPHTCKCTKRLTQINGLPFYCRAPYFRFLFF